MKIKRHESLQSCIEEFQNAVHGYTTVFCSNKHFSHCSTACFCLLCVVFSGGRISVWCIRGFSPSCYWSELNIFIYDLKWIKCVVNMLKWFVISRVSPACFPLSLFHKRLVSVLELFTSHKCPAGKDQRGLRLCFIKKISYFLHYKNKQNYSTSSGVCEIKCNFWLFVKWIEKFREILWIWFWVSFFFPFWMCAFLYVCPHWCVVSESLEPDGELVGSSPPNMIGPQDCHNVSFVKRRNDDPIKISLKGCNATCYSLFNTC